MNTARGQGLLSLAKTEREACALSEEIAKENGFVPLSSKEELKPGDKVYAINNKKAILLAVIGTGDIDGGVSLVGAHIDSPRIDLKSRPLFEDENIAWLKTQYYGGIKKYQWLALPLAMHGTVCKSDGTSVEVCIGEDAADPVFTITDLLPHLSQEQMQKQLAKAFDADNFHVLIGSLPKGGDDIKEKIKFNILSMLFEKYGMVEEDFYKCGAGVRSGGQRARRWARPLVCRRVWTGRPRMCVCGAKGHHRRMYQGRTEKRRRCVCLSTRRKSALWGQTGMKSRFFELTLGEMITKLKGRLRRVYVKPRAGEQLLPVGGRRRGVRPAVSVRLRQKERRVCGLRRADFKIHRRTRQVRLERRKRRIRGKGTQNL